MVLKHNPRRYENGSPIVGGHTLCRGSGPGTGCRSSWLCTAMYHAKEDPLRVLHLLVDDGIHFLG